MTFHTFLQVALYAGLKKTTLTFLGVRKIQQTVLKTAKQRASTTAAVMEWIGIQELKAVRNVG